MIEKEIKKPDVMKADKEQKIKMLNAGIKDQTAKVGVLTEEIEEANTMISDIVTFTKEATEVRETEKKENALATKDSKQAQTSVPMPSLCSGLSTRRVVRSQAAMGIHAKASELAKESSHMGF